MDKEIKIKDSSVLKGLMAHKFHHKLVPLIAYISDKYGLMMTESYRKKRHRNDLHGTDPVRACDLRFRYYKSQKLAYEISDDINNKWVYDSNRPDMMCCIVHDSGEGIHFHIQVHPKTLKRAV